MDFEKLYAQLRAGGGKGGRPLSAKTVGHVHAVLRKAMRDAVRWKRLPRAPTEGARPPRGEKVPPAVSTPGDLRVLLAVIDDPDLSTLVELAALTGARKQELLALEWSDIDLTGSRLTISKAVEETRRGVRVKPPKTGAGSRTIHLPERAATSLRTHRKRQLELRVRLGEWPYGALVFPDYKGGGVRSPRCVSQAVWRARKRAGITGGTLLGFRHAHATELLRAGVHPKVVQERLGHAGIAVTMDIYASVLPAMDRDAADKIGSIFVDQNVDQS
jgi:integrase